MSADPGATFSTAAAGTTGSTHGTAHATRSASSIELGAGPRASIALMKAAQALALIDSEEYVRPEHVRELAVPVLAHRLALDAEARYSGSTAESAVRTVLQAVPVPA